eukprot:CAMPEP_0177681526 /NCGR_PEP_ID=MMETSP0447-20121125/30767_1 /TAXON_ID=0 /ORGANISM="Stygamoeba regulata, Strain BSH-02190019" /LENGTH=611 /DNA_ID=CAMNT_0019190957 /DNA_START=9 /DNA_END=1841 /DNA_ORIENTATION=+
MATQDRIVARVHLPDDQILRQVGLNNTYKSLLLTPTCTPSNTTASMIKAMSKGMSPADKNVIEVKCAAYQFFITIGKKRERVVETDENLYDLYNSSTKAKKPVQLTFKAPPPTAGSRLHKSSDGKSKAPVRKGTSSKDLPPIGGAAFGVPLSEICEYSFATHRWQPPPIFSDTLRYVAKFGVTFRVSALSAEVDSFATAYDLGLPVNSSEFSDAHVAAGLMKQWLRELPEPLIPFSMYDTVCSIAKFCKDEQLKREYMHQLIYALPQPNQTIMVRLMELLDLVLENEKDNLMTPKNLGVVFGPNIIWAKEETPETLMDTPVLNTMTEALVQCARDYKNPPKEMFTGTAFVGTEKSNLIFYHGSLTLDQVVGKDLQGQEITQASSNLTSAYLFPKDVPPTRQAEELKKRAALSRTSSIGLFLKKSSADRLTNLDGAGGPKLAAEPASESAAGTEPVASNAAEVSQAHFAMAVKALSALVLDMQGQIDELKKAQGKADEARLPIMRKQISSILSGVGIATAAPRQESTRTLQIPGASPSGARPPSSPRGTPDQELELIQPGETVKAVYSFSPDRTDMMTFSANELIVVQKKITPSWWFGRMEDGRAGLFPAKW